MLAQRQVSKTPQRQIFSREEVIKPADTGHNSHSLQQSITTQRHPKTRALRKTTVDSSDETDKNDEGIGLAKRPEETNHRPMPTPIQEFQKN